MGRKHTGTGKYIHICLAFIVFSTIWGCTAPVENTKTDNPAAQTDVIHWRLLRNDNASPNFGNQSSSKSEPTGDEALFNTALRFADPGNPAKDYNKSTATFKKLITGYPKSTWAYRGHIIIEILQENAKLKKQLGDLQLDNAKARKQGTDLQQENTRLKEIIEQSKKVDIEIEQKKRE
jgi:hypothetical protein